jgi:hypothetical protein
MSKNETRRISNATRATRANRTRINGTSSRLLDVNQSTIHSILRFLSHNNQSIAKRVSKQFKANANTYHSNNFNKMFDIINEFVDNSIKLYIYLYTDRTIFDTQKKKFDPKKLNERISSNTGKYNELLQYIKDNKNDMKKLGEELSQYDMLDKTVFKNDSKNNINHLVYMYDITIRSIDIQIEKGKNKYRKLLLKICKLFNYITNSNATQTEYFTENYKDPRYNYIKKKHKNIPAYDLYYININFILLLMKYSNINYINTMYKSFQGIRKEYVIPDEYKE